MSETDMPEPTDAIMPILKRIQGDLGELKRDHAAHRAETAKNTETLEAIQHYFVYQLGLTTKNGADIELLQEQIKAMEARLSALETRS
jgi:cell division protein FtsB